VIITGGSYAQAANVSEQKLNVLGGVWDGYAVPAVGDDRLHGVIDGRAV